MKGYAGALIAVLLSSAVAVSTAAGVPLSPKALALFRSLHIPIALPHYLPPGYHAVEYGVERPPPGRAMAPGIPYYFVLYRRGKHECLVYESGIGGLGGIDVSAYHKIMLHSRFLGNPPMEYGDHSFFILGVDEHAPGDRWYNIAPVENPKLYAHASGCTRGPSPTVAARIAESIGYI